MTNRLKELIKKGLSVLRVPSPLGLSDYAKQNYYLVPESSAIEGRWEPHPYQVEIMNTISNDDVEKITWKKSMRVGYTKILCAAVCYFIEHKKRNIVIYQPTDSDARDFVNDEIDPLFRHVKVFADALRCNPYVKHSYNTNSKKMFYGATLDIKGGKTERSYRRISKDVVILDELDAFGTDIEGKGSPVKMAEGRASASSYPKILLGSTPGISGLSMIESSLKEADIVFYRFLPCPKCDTFQKLEFAHLKIKESPVFYECQSCAHSIMYSDLYPMDEKGVWNSECGVTIKDGKFYKKNKKIDAPIHVGFFIWSAYSYSISWEKIAREFLEASSKAKVGDVADLQAFTTLYLGEAWEVDRGERVSSHELMGRRELYDADIPEKVKFLTAGVDIQKDRIEIAIEGWGKSEENWAIDYIIIIGNTEQPQIWEHLLKVLVTSYLDAKKQPHRVKLACIDSGYLSDNVYNFCAVNGAGWLIPVRGASKHWQPIINFPGKRNKNGVYLTVVGADTAKELIYGRYRLTSGEGVNHWPLKKDKNGRDVFDDTYFRQATAEARLKKYHKGVPYYTWDAQKRRNEVTDCKVYNLAAIRILQQYMRVDLSDDIKEKKTFNYADLAKKMNK